MAAIYKCVLNGEYGGKDNQNTLWYRTAVDPFGGAFGMGGAVELADQIEAQIVPAYLEVKPLEYTLQSIDIYPHNDLFELAYQNPYRRTIAEGSGGAVNGSALDSSALAVNLRFNLEPVLFGPQRLSAPKRGYLAIGPVPSSLLNNDGKLTDDFLTAGFEAWGTLKNRLCQNLTSLLPPAVFYPIRVSQKWGIVDGMMGLISWGYADVQGGDYDRYATFRRSRRIRG